MSDSPTLTSQLCEFIRKHEPVRTPALRDAFPDCRNPAALLTGPVGMGYLVACEITGSGATGRTSKLLEYRLSAVAGKQSYEDFKARGLPPPATSATPLKHKTLRGRASTEALEQPVRKAPEGPVKKGAPPLAPWPGKKERAVFVDGKERFVSASSTALPQAPEPVKPARTQDDATAPVPGLLTDPKFVLQSSGELLVYQGSTQIEFTALAAQQLADFVGRVRSAIDAAVSNSPGASA